MSLTDWNYNNDLLDFWNLVEDIPIEIIDELFANMATPAQEKLIPLYDGEEGEPALAWCRQLDGAKRQYNWSNEDTARVAKKRMSGAALFWLNAQLEQGDTFPQWDQAAAAPLHEDILLLRKNILERFYGSLSWREEFDASKDVLQKPGEKIKAFSDRLLMAIGRQHFNLTQAEKDTDVHKNQVKKEHLNKLGGGLLPAYYDELIARGAQRYPDVKSLVDAAQKFEVELLKRKPAFGTIAAVQTEKIEDENPEMKELAATVNEMSVAVAAGKPEDVMAAAVEMVQRQNRGGFSRGTGNRGRGFGRGQPSRRGGSGPPGPSNRCHNCGGTDHFARTCPRPRNTQTQRGGYQQGYPGFSQRGGFQQSFPQQNFQPSWQQRGGFGAMAPPRGGFNPRGQNMRRVYVLGQEVGYDGEETVMAYSMEDNSYQYDQLNY